MKHWMPLAIATALVCITQAVCAYFICCQLDNIRVHTAVIEDQISDATAVK